MRFWVPKTSIYRFDQGEKTLWFQFRLVKLARFWSKLIILISYVKSRNCMESVDCFIEYQFNLVGQSCPTLCDPMNRSAPGLPVHPQLPELTQTHVHWVGDAIQPSYPLSSPSPPALDLSQCRCLLKWDSASHQVAKILEFQDRKSVV